MPTDQWKYDFPVREVLRVVDGDTIDVRIGQPFGLSLCLRFRLAGVDAYERYGSEANAKGLEAKEFTEQWLKEKRGLLRVQG